MSHHACHQARASRNSNIASRAQHKMQLTRQRRTCKTRLFQAKPKATRARSTIQGSLLRQQAGLVHSCEARMTLRAFLGQCLFGCRKCFFQPRSKHALLPHSSASTLCPARAAQFTTSCAQAQQTGRWVAPQPESVHLSNYELHCLRCACTSLRTCPAHASVHFTVTLCTPLRSSPTAFPAHALHSLCTCPTHASIRISLSTLPAHASTQFTLYLP